VVVERNRCRTTLTWQDGEIWTQNPDDDTFQLMIELAQALGARVRGDELETYRSVSETYSHPEDAQAATESREYVARLRRKHRLLQLLPLAPFVAAALLVGYCSRPH
jgi:hypothetical protein